MQSSYSAKQIADLGIPGIPASERGIQLKAKKEQWHAIKQPCQGGYIVKYLTSLLPGDIRMAIAAAHATKKIQTTPGRGATAGAELATAIIKQEAEAEAQAQAAKERGLAAYHALPKGKKAIADARFEVLQAKNTFLQAASLKVKAGTQAFCRHYQTGSLKLPECTAKIIGKTISWSTINRWQQAYDALGLAGLAPGYNNPKKGLTTVPENMCTLVQGLMVAHRNIKLSKVMDGLAARFQGQELPGESAVRRYMDNYAKTFAGILLTIANPDKARSYRQPAFGSASDHVLRLNQIWELDSTKGDVMLQGGRHCVMGCIDVYSRRLKLLVSKTSKATAVAALMRACILDWGVPEAIRTDNGSDYVSNHMERVVDGLGLGWDLCEPFQPQQKPHIERSFKTFSHGLVELLPGFVGHSVADRKDIEAARSFADRIMAKGDTAEVNMSAAEFQTLCDRWLNAIYHQNPHAGLGGKKPAEMARGWLEPIRRISDERALDCLLSEAAGNNGLRTVTKKGVQADNIWYQAPEFGAFVDEARQIRVLEDAADLGQIHCYEPDTGLFICVAVDPLRKGIDRAEMAAKGMAIYKQTYKDGAKALRKIARDTKAEGIYEEILLHRESIIANTIELPKLAMGYTTPALEQASLAAEAMAGKRKEPIQLTADEFAKSESILMDLERKSGIRLMMPSSEAESYAMLTQERDAQGLELSDREERWMTEYELFLETGKRRGLLAEGWQPYAERAKIAREATGK